MPSAGNCAIGLMPAEYKSSLSSEVSRLETSSTGTPPAPSESPPRAKPAGAYHGARTRSLNEKAPRAATEGGAQRA